MARNRNEELKNFGKRLQTEQPNLSELIRKLAKIYSFQDFDNFNQVRNEDGSIAVLGLAETINRGIESGREAFALVLQARILALNSFNIPEAVTDLLDEAFVDLQNQVAQTALLHLYLSSHTDTVADSYIRALFHIKKNHPQSALFVYMEERTPEINAQLTRNEWLEYFEKIKNEKLKGEDKTELLRQTILKVSDYFDPDAG